MAPGGYPYRKRSSGARVASGQLNYSGTEHAASDGRPRAVHEPEGDGGYVIQQRNFEERRGQDMCNRRVILGLVRYGHEFLVFIKGNRMTKMPSCGRNLICYSKYLVISR